MTCNIHCNELDDLANSDVSIPFFTNKPSLKQPNNSFLYSNNTPASLSDLIVPNVGYLHVKFKYLQPHILRPSKDGCRLGDMTSWLHHFISTHSKTHTTESSGGEIDMENDFLDKSISHTTISDVVYPLPPIRVCLLSIISYISYD